MVSKGRMAEIKRIVVQKNKPVRSEIIFRTKAKTFRVSRFTKINYKHNNENIFLAYYFFGTQPFGISLRSSVPKNNMRNIFIILIIALKKMGYRVK